MNASAKAEFVVQEKGVKWIVRPAGNSGSCGDDKRYQDWHTFGELEEENSRF